MRVLVSEPLSQEGLDILNRHVEVDYRPRLTAAELPDAVRPCDGLVVRSATQVTEAVLAAAPRLRVIGRAGVGVNNIDLEAATARGIVVLNVPDGNTIAACEHTLGMMLALARNIPQAAAELREGRWERGRFTGVELYGKTLGVVGFGRIGSEVARRALAFGMRVVAYDPFAVPEHAAKLGVRLGTLEEVLREADFLTVHAPLTAETRDLIGARELAMMKPGSRLVNCARGGIINEEALLAALKGGHLAGAALDVFSREPVAPDNPLLALPNVVATPHLGASTVEAQVVCAVQVAEEVVRALHGLPVRNAVNLPSLPEEVWKEVAPLLPLAEIIGRFFAQALPGTLARVEVEVRGVADARAAEAVAQTALAGLLSETVDEPVNQVNALVLARRKGIRFSVVRPGDGQSSPRGLSLRSGEGAARHTLSGHVGALGLPRIAEIDGLPLDMAPSRYMLLDFHEDRPGIIGRVGTILGQHGINIAAMYVGRHETGAQAVMVLAVDDPVPEAVLAELRRVPHVREFRVISLPPHLLRPGGSPPLGGEAAGAAGEQEAAAYRR